MKASKTTLLLLIVSAIGLLFAGEPMRPLTPVSLSMDGFPRDFRGVFHIHSELSLDSRGKLSEIIEAANFWNIDFAVMTDHFRPELDTAKYADPEGRILFIKGAEMWERENVTVLAFPLPLGFRPTDNWRENVSELRRRGAIVFSGHAEKTDVGDLEKFDGLEVMNLHAHLTEGGKGEFYGRIAKLFWPMNWDMKFLIDTVDNLEKWKRVENDSARIFPAVLGNDSHNNLKLFWFFGPNPSSYKRTFGLGTVHIWADSLGEGAVVEALRRGRSYFAFEIFGRTEGFRFYATDGKRNYLPGDTAEFSGERLDLAFELPAFGTDTSSIIKTRILRNGAIYRESDGDEIAFSRKITETGLYRMEILKNGHPWIYSNSILIK